MEHLNSSWLLHMIYSSEEKPSDQLLSIYWCLNTLLMIPSVRESFAREYDPDVSLAKACPVLTAHLIDLATKARIPNPSSYVTHMYILLQGALAEELRSPGSGALLRAQDGARSVMKAVKPKLLEPVKQTLLVGGAVASAILLCLVVVYMKPFETNGVRLPVAQTGAPVQQVPIQSVMSPDLIGQVIALKENFEAGNCPAPELLTMPQNQMAAYLNVIKSGGFSQTEIDTQKLRTFLNWYAQHRASECYFKTENKQKFILGMSR